MKTRKLIWTAGLILAGAAVVVFYLYIRPALAARKLEFTYTRLEKGDIQATISSTGTLEAINTVQVGTQISGTIGRIYADYNTRVQKGQLLAEMDIRLLNTTLQNARAGLSVANTQLRQTLEDFERNKVLFEKKVITGKEYTDSRYAYEQALSNKEAADYYYFSSLPGKSRSGSLADTETSAGNQGHLVFK